jgi:hypothetical protein
MKKKIISLLSSVNIKPLLFIIFCENLLDAYFTLSWIDAGVATEANPLMAYLLALGTHWFLIGKIGAITLACGILFYCRQIKSAKIVAIISCFIYLGIIIFHIWGAYDLGLPLFWIF